MTQHLDRLHFTRESERRTSDDKLLDGLQFIAQRALTGAHGRGWAYEIGSIEAEKLLSETWTFSSWIRFYRRLEASSPEREREQREQIYQHAALAGHSARFGSKPWITKLDKKLEQLQSEPTNGDGSGTTSSSADRESVSLSSVTKISKGDYFDHLYGLDPQIRVLLSAVQAAADSKKRNRFHSLLWGEPGAGKTDILRSLARLLDDLGVSYMEIDATATTEAGMKKILTDEDEIVPDIFLIEEIEKSPGNSTHWLLGVMDQRGTVTQLNFRKSATRKVDALILASANDYRLMKSRESGALLSRFQNHIYCPRVTRENMAKILKREVLAVNGDLAWIEPALEFCYDKRGITDPRAVIPVCLQGKESLVRGDYQQDLEKTMREEIITQSKPKPDLELFS